MSCTRRIADCTCLVQTYPVLTSAVQVAAVAMDEPQPEHRIIDDHLTSFQLRLAVCQLHHGRPELPVEDQRLHGWIQAPDLPALACRDGLRDGGLGGGELRWGEGTLDMQIAIEVEQI